MDSGTKNARYNIGVEHGLRQFLNHDGPKGSNDNYKRGWEFNFSFTDEQRAEVIALIDSGMLFDDAFDKVKNKA